MVVLTNGERFKGGGKGRVGEGLKVVGKGGRLRVGKWIRVVGKRGSVKCGIGEA